MRSATRALALAAVASATVLVAPPVVHPGIDSAWAAHCSNADALPTQISTTQARAAVVCLLNEQRAENDRRSLRVKGALNRAAWGHSDYMRDRACFSHQCPGERDLKGRLRDAGYLPCRCRWRAGENLGWGSTVLGTPSGIVNAWMNSPDHRAILLKRRFRHVGVGIVWGSPTLVQIPVSGIYTADLGFKKKRGK